MPANRNFRALPPQERDIVRRARNFAVLVHGDQLYGKHPYVHHLDAVVELLRYYDHDFQCQMLGYLHDVGEDTSVTRHSIVFSFGPYMADLVELISDPAGDNRAERKVKLHARMRTLNGTGEERVLIVKTADRLANVKQCLEDGDYERLAMYAGEHDSFHDAVHRIGLCNHLWAELNHLIEQAKLIPFLTQEGYINIRLISGQLCSLKMMAFTWAICVDIDAHCTKRRYCYETMLSAAMAFTDYTDVNQHPTGPWIKCKGMLNGEFVDMLNPNMQ